MVRLFDTELDAPLEVAREESDIEPRRAIGVHAQERRYEQALSEFHGATYEVMTSTVRGFEHYLNHAFVGLWQAWQEP